MFGIGNRNVKVEPTIMERPVLVPVVPERQPIQSGLSCEDRKAYLKTAREIGLQGDPMLRLLLEEGGFEIYPYGKVCDYLDQIFGIQGKDDTWEQHWGWRGLRTSDVQKNHYGGRWLERDCLIAGPYEKEIPLAVIMTVEKVKNHFKEMGAPPVRFLVSDKIEARDKPDPFLAVMWDNERFVIERWNEPGFKL